MPISTGRSVLVRRRSRRRPPSGRWPTFYWRSVAALVFSLTIVGMLAV